MKQDFQGKKVLVCGMALSGTAAARLLADLGAELMLHDRKAEDELPEDTRQALEGLSYENFLGKDPLAAVETADMLVVSPGLPPNLPFLRKAQSLGIPILAEIELGYLASQADFIAITGTNGKTTTTALTGEIFKAAGLPTYVLGNIGDPICAHALSTKPGEVVVAETAALQLDAIRDYHPRGSAILNITPDHLDRYQTMENYTEAKARVFLNQTQDDYCVLNFDDPRVAALAPRVAARKVWFSLEPLEHDGVCVEDGDIVYLKEGTKTRIMPADAVHIPGRHNLQNALCAAALALEYGIDANVCAKTLATFPGVEHRIETVREVESVLYVNDSKGTNPDATIKAIAAMTRPIHLILGGFDKHADFDELMQNLEGVKQIIVLGQTKDKITHAAAAAGFTQVHPVDDLEQAVSWAHDRASAGDCVLLSPACASWDMYPNFEVRGAHFKRLVMKL